MKNNYANFMRWSAVAAVVLPAVFAAGCNQAAGGAVRMLGPVSYDKAFSTSRAVMGQYFSLAESNRAAGVIRSRPKFVEADQYRLTSPAPARQIATLRLNRDGRFVIARLSVVVQREGSDAYRYVNSGEHNYSALPKRTPAEIEAATTDEQNRTWQVLRYDHKLEWTILDQIAKALRPGRTGRNDKRQNIE